MNNYCDKCNRKCHEHHCGCGVPTIDIDEMPETVAILKFNFNGVSTWYDYTNMIQQTQTDTSISLDALKRVITYMAERHTDSISAKELGSILRIADISDVDTSNAGDNALFVYKKNANCGRGCVGGNNAWNAWNSLSNQKTFADTIMGFDENGAPLSLQKPISTNKHYLLSWAAQDKLKYVTPTAFATVADKKQLYIDPNTGEIGYNATSEGE